MYDGFEGVWITEPIKQIGPSFLAERITLDELYQRGWWITEIFGSYATVVSESGYHQRHNSYEHGRPYFCCRQCQIDTKALSPKVMRKINAIKNAKWKKYKRIMLEPKKRSYDRRYC